MFEYKAVILYMFNMHNTRKASFYLGNILAEEAPWSSGQSGSNMLQKVAVRLGVRG